ncbi:hypothetical protein PIB30_072394 [Stylosanthes scabra]|uniref:DUF4283 domain-containing protein n=1 Tax=Stylosanthes scabra TaxID=79078 RepID=A0ABU6XRK6_9FABA|nr:hypothetical protein [Stylosanthes scabra]
MASDQRDHTMPRTEDPRKSEDEIVVLAEEDILDGISACARNLTGFKNFILHVQRWRDLDAIDANSITTFPVWVQLWGVPEEFKTLEVGHETRNCHIFLEHSALDEIKEDSTGEWKFAQQPSSNTNSAIGGTRQGNGKENEENCKKVCLRDNVKFDSLVEVHNLKGLCRSHFPELGFICETKNQTRQVEQKLRLCSVSDWFIIDPNGTTGGLAMAWKDTISVRILNHDRYFIAAEVTDNGLNEVWGVIGVHLSPNE